MSEDLGIPSGGGDTSSTPAPSPAQNIKDAALTEMARDEDISNYKAEREAREAEAKGEQVNGADRAARIREALTKAREETQQVRQQKGSTRRPT